MKACQNSRDLQAIISLVVFTATVTLAFIKMACPCASAFSSFLFGSNPLQRTLALLKHAVLSNHI